MLALYWSFSHKRQNVLLLLASYVFYGAWDWRFLSLIFISTVVDFRVGRALQASDDEGRRKRLLGISLVVNLGILATFKYYGFFVESAIGLLSWFGFSPNPPLLQVLLPVGISFYTFQTLSYTFDIFRRRMEATDDFFTFATFVAYFPQLVAGPIERARRLLPQLHAERPKPTVERFRSGFFLILLGLFKKVAIADALGGFVQNTFDSSASASSWTLLVAAWALLLQFYGDLSGYTDIARGTSRLFGIELMRNFEQPLLSRNVTEFWRTWHISLSSWLHDYLYVPLGGNKRGPLIRYRNLMITMLLGGLWHGASMNFVVWGGLHGLALCVHQLAGGSAPRGELPPLKLSDVPRIVGTFTIVSFITVFFLAQTMGQAFTYLGGLFSLRGGAADLDGILLFAICIVLVIGVDLAQRLSGRHDVVIAWPAYARGASYAAISIWLLIWLGGAAQEFIYFQF